MSITIASVTFDNVDYDDEADVLYLHVGNPSRAVQFEESPEGHHLRFDEHGQLVGVTIVGAKDLIARGQALVLTVPQRIEVSSSSLAGAMAQ